MPRQKTLYDLEQLEKLREKNMGILSRLQQYLPEKMPVFRWHPALYQLLTQLDTQHQLWNREQQLLGAGRGKPDPREYAQIYTIVMQLLEKYNLLLGEEPLQIRDFYRKCWRQDFPLQTWL